MTLTERRIRLRVADYNGSLVSGKKICENGWGTLGYPYMSLAPACIDSSNSQRYTNLLTDIQSIENGTYIES
jgi:hypothetical protein